MFHHTSHFNLLLSVWIFDETLFLVFDILLETSFSDHFEAFKIGTSVTVAPFELAESQKLR